MKESSHRSYSHGKTGVVKNPIERSTSGTGRNNSEDSLDWEIELSEAEGFKDDEGKLLTSLVRQTYIYHLQKSLFHNYECWFNSYGDGVELSESFIIRCAAQMEKKAVRACMLANLYQHSVVKLIKGIKKSTDHKKLYEDLLTSLNSSKKCDKSVQTDDFTQITPNNFGVTNALTPTNFDPLNIECTSTPNIEVTDFSINVSNLCTTNSYFQPPEPVPSPFDTSNTVPASQFIFSYLPKNNTNGQNKCSMIPSVDASEFELSMKSNDPPVLHPFKEKRNSLEEKKPVKRKEVSSKNFPQESSPKKRKCISETPSNRNLEERLKKFEEIFGDPCEDVQAEPQPPDKSNDGTYSKFFSIVSWKQESVAQICELNKRLLLMPLITRKMMQIKFKRLFGINDPVTEISPEQFTICRRRLANMVVAHLTPYYDLALIESRAVFKALAREITRIILNETYAPDMKFSKDIVDEIFRNGTKYKTLEDVNALCSR